MSTFGHQYKNPVYENGDLEDPAHVAAGKVLEENEIKRGGTQTVTKVPLVFKLLLLLVAAIAVIALVCSLLFYTGKVIPESIAERPKQDPQAGFGLSNQQLFDAIVALQQRVKELEDANTTTRGIISDLTERLTRQEQKHRDDVTLLQTNINSTINMSRTDDAALDIKLQKNINDTIDKCMEVNNTLTDKLAEQEKKHSKDVIQLQTNINTTINMSRTDDAALDIKLQKNINDTIDKCMEVNNTLTDKLAEQEQKHREDVTQLQTNINSTINMSRTDDAKLEARLQKNINGTIDKFNSLQNTHIDDVTQLNMNITTSITNVNSSLSARIVAIPNIKQCSVNVNASAQVTSEPSAAVNVTVQEQTGKTKLLHVSCSSNIADSVQLEPVVLGDGQYVCTCRGQGNFNDTTPAQMICYATYTECTLPTA